jgi:hypothetical protein
MKRSPWLVLAVLLLAAAGSDAGAYDYPLKDPYLATIIGTPSEYGPELPDRVDAAPLHLRVFPERAAPEVFWYQRAFQYSLAAQREKAPLMFVIAGTGSSHNAASMQLLERIFFQAGFHVIRLPSPTQMNFITTASTTGVPGHIVDDAADLYRVMTLACEQVGSRIQVSDIHLTGYSLGASQAAFVAKLDDEKRLLNFKKVYMINPPVSLFASAKVLDDMLARALPGGMDEFDAFFRRILGRFAEIYRIMGYVDFSDDYLYAVYRTVYKELAPNPNDLAGIIGAAFRFASMNMVFTADVMANYGLIVPRNLVLGRSDSLTDYYKVTSRISFIDYFEEFFYPFFKARTPGVTREALIHGTSLRSIEAYLRSATKIGLAHNEDDVILAPGDIGYLKELFGPRARIYPWGGHLGNMGFRDNVAHMLDFFKN